MMRGLEGRTAIVTGGASGIGRAICVRLAEEGCKVAIFDISADKATETVSEIRQADRTARSWTIDITNHDAVKEAVSAVEDELGAIDVLVNNAGWDQMMPFVKTTPDFWNKVIAINLYGPLNLHHAVIPGMIVRRRGKIVNVASDAGRVGSSGEAVYSFCKGGLIAFSKTIARETARHGICVNTLCPGPTDTPLLKELAADGEQGARIVDAVVRAVPFRRLAQPNDYPGLVAFLASADADYITGQTISVSGGLSMHG